LAAEINTQDVNYENLEKRKKQLKNEIDSVISELDSTRYGKNEISKGFYDIAFLPYLYCIIGRLMHCLFVLP
jgi:hypothetical protein